MLTTPQEAQAAIEALDGKHTWPGMDCTMVVKPMDMELQRRHNEVRVNNAAAAAAHTYGPMLVPLPQSQPVGAAASPTDTQAVFEAPPRGCAPDAIKWVLR